MAPSHPTTVVFAALVAVDLAACCVLAPRHAEAAGTAPPPLTPLVVLRDFEPPNGPYAPGHRGVDLAAAVGASVRASIGGTVSFAGVVAGTAVVSVTDGTGRKVTYEPVTTALVAGDRVSPGDVLGHLGATLPSGHPRCEQPCLHWGLLVDGSYRDPLALLADPRVRLLPWSGEPDDVGGVP